MVSESDTFYPRPRGRYVDYGHQGKQSGIPSPRPWVLRSGLSMDGFGANSIPASVGATLPEHRPDMDFPGFFGIRTGPTPRIAAVGGNVGNCTTSLQLDQQRPKRARLSPKIAVEPISLEGGDIHCVHFSCHAGACMSIGSVAGVECLFLTTLLPNIANRDS